jgi:hypothetical protein
MWVQSDVILNGLGPDAPWNHELDEKAFLDVKFCSFPSSFKKLALSSKVPKNQKLERYVCKNLAQCSKEQVP